MKNYNPHIIGKGRYVWAAVLVYGLILAGCAGNASQSAPALSADEKHAVDRKARAHMALSSLSAEDLYRMSSSEFEQFKEDLKLNKVSELTWKKLFSKLQENSPIDWKFGQIAERAETGQCAVAEYPNGGSQVVAYLPPPGSEKIETARDGTRYISLSEGRISRYLDKYIRYELPPNEDYICIDDHKKQLIAANYKITPSRPKGEDSNCTVFVTNVAQHLSFWPLCRTVDGDDQYYYHYSGDDKFCQLSGYWAEAQFKCIPSQDILKEDESDGYFHQLGGDN